MYRMLPQDIIAVTCENASVAYAVDHMRMGAKWVFQANSELAVLHAGFTSLLKHAEDMDLDYTEHLELRSKFAQLAPREWQVISLVLDGKTNKEIAKELDVSVRTVESRRSKAYGKVGVHNLASMVRCFDRAALLRKQFEVCANVAASSRPIFHAIARRSITDMLTYQPLPRTASAVN